MVLIGLTGGIASGKSTISKMLKELGAEVIDADLVAREVIQPRSAAWREMVEAFGKGILNDDRTINRRRLGNVVFPDPKAVEKLNSITHPRIIRRIEDRIEDARKRGINVLVIDAPLLIESGMVPMVDEVWVVMVDPDTQISRLMTRDHFTFQEAINRLNSQMPLEEKLRYAHRVINNKGTPEETRAEVVRGWNDVLERAANN